MTLRRVRGVTLAVIPRLTSRTVRVKRVLRPLPPRVPKTCSPRHHNLWRRCHNPWRKYRNHRKTQRIVGEPRKMRLARNAWVKGRSSLTKSDLLRLSKMRKSGRHGGTTMVDQGNGREGMSRTKSQRNNSVRSWLTVRLREYDSFHRSVQDEQEQDGRPHVQLR
jgi:hypothetical protein